jgi:hypothetical protein
MAKKTRVILVDETGGVTQLVKVEQKKIEKIKWLPEIEGNSITITFINNIPFSDRSWKAGTRTGSGLTGKLKLFELGNHEFEYEVKGVVGRRRGRANPKLIVDGGRRKPKKR